MKRVTLRVPEDQLASLERLVENGEYPNRSEAIRTAMRELVRRESEDTVIIDSPRVVQRADAPTRVPDRGGPYDR